MKLLKQALYNLNGNKGFAKDKRVSDDELERIKEKTFNKILKTFKYF